MRIVYIVYFKGDLFFASLTVHKKKKTFITN